MLSWSFSLAALTVGTAPKHVQKTHMENDIQLLARAISNPSRYRILEALFEGKKNVSTIIKLVKLPQPAVSQYLKTLKATNVVVNERRGKEIIYAANTNHILALLASLKRQVQTHQ